MKKINRRDILNLLKENKDQFFSVVFLKKNGEYSFQNINFNINHYKKSWMNLDYNWYFFK